MRELKFRTPCKCQNGHHAFLFYCVRFGDVYNSKWEKDKECKCPTFDYGEGFAQCASDEQWTGLKDRDGVDIYENDIVVLDGYPFFDDGKPNYVGVVEWMFTSWQYVLECVNPDNRGISSGINHSLDDDGEGGKHFRVIGNVHQNPDLLAVKR